MIALGYMLAIFVGFSLGILGTGGAVFTIPIFIYVWHFQDKQAIASGFIIVVLVGIFSALKHLKDGHINFRLLAVFAPTTMLGTLIGTHFSHYLPGDFQLFMLAAVMSTSALLMFMPHPHQQGVLSTDDELTPFKVLHSVWFLGLGICVGLLVGLVGVGGGFLMLSILATLVHVPMRQAIGTALAVAILNAFVGGLSTMQKTTIPWDRVLSFAAIAILGSVVGACLSSRLSIPKLRKAFAMVLILVAGAIVCEKVAYFARTVPPLSFYMLFK